MQNYRIIKSIQPVFDKSIERQVIEEINNQLRYFYDINRYVVLLGVLENPILQSLTLEILYGRGVFHFRISKYEPIDIDHIISTIEPEVRNANQIYKER